MVWQKTNWKNMELKSFRSCRNTLSGSFLVREPTKDFVYLNFLHLIFCTLWYWSDVISGAEEQTDNGGDEWIDTTIGRARGDYDDDDTDSSTYFRNQTTQGHKRKKAPFFKYSKKRKGYGNTSSNSKGSVVCLFHILSSYFTLHSWNFFPFSSLFCLAVMLWIQSRLQHQ